MKIGEKLVSNSIYLFFDWLIVTVFSLVFWLTVGKTLSAYDYGVIATAINTVSILSSFALIGLSSAAPKLISEYLGSKDKRRAQAITSFSLKIVLLTSSIIGLILFFTSGYVSSIYNTPQISLQIAALALIPASIYMLSSSILQGYQDMRKIFSTDGFGYAVKAGLALVLILLGFKFVGPLVGWLFSYLVIVLLRAKYFKQLSADGINKRFIIFSYAIPAFISSIIFVFLSNTPVIIISSIAGPTLSGLFAISLTVTYPIAMIPSILSMSLFPLVSGLMSQKNSKSRQRRLIHFVMRYSFFTMLPILILFSAFSKELILFFATISYLKAVKFIPYLSIASFLFGLGGILNQSIYAIRKPKVSQYIAIIATAVFFILVFPLTLSLSAIGTAIAYLISGLSFSIVSYIFLRKLLKFNFPTKPIIKIILSSLVVILISFLSLTLPIIFKILFAILSLVMYLIILIPLKFYLPEDVRLLRILAKKSPALKNIFRFAEKILSKYVKEADYRKNNL